jgi:SAM-dependent methyltransferase
MPCNLDEIRRAELELLRPHLHAGTRVLEVGGGLGVQARILASWGCEVESIDLAERNVGDRLVFPVTEYDGVNIPFRDDSFDAVFSSNVLEHVTDLPGLLSDIRRVLRGSGVAIHLMPTPAWRFWTSVAHYVWVAQVGLARAVGRPTEGIGFFEGPKPSHVVATRGWMYALRRGLLPGSHGEFPSAIAELRNYSAASWSRVLTGTGFKVERVQGTGIFYAGYGIFSGLTVERRRRLARLLGSACNVYLTRAPDSPSTR